MTLLYVLYLSAGEGQLCQFALVSSVLSVMSVQSFCGKDEGFLAKTKDFFYFSSSSPMFTLDTNEGGACTEHVQTY